MGKKIKKTRWRTFTLNGHQSDSEESCTKLQGDSYQRKYTKFSYSSHSSPIRKFEHDSSKTTRSNSTTSEKKATFNEDEYTRITTPRQDVLFKKGYLNKPKTYQTQTSTGTCSTANSTSTCTPDHQSADGTEGTDLEYESQFVFPNGFIDQNGVYYINSFEPFPVVVYNAPICYTEYPNARTKRYSTDSTTESVSPQNEESGATQPSEEEKPIRVKKKRRRKISSSKSITSDASSDDVFKTEGDHKSDAQDLLLKSINKYELKPDAEEFIPRTLHNETVPFDPNVQFFNIQSNFIPVPFINGDLQNQFVPVNFIPAAQNYVVPEANVQVQEVKTEAEEVKKKNEIDIAKIVWKLEEAAKEQHSKKGYNRSKARVFQRQRFNHYQKQVTKPEAEKKSVWKKSELPTITVEKSKPIEKKTEVKVVPTPVPSPRKPNQWIPVANRKKRKNKSVDEVVVEDDPEEPPPLSDDLFESFDIDQLVDVVPPSPVVDKVETPIPVESKLVELQETNEPIEKKKKKKNTKLIKKVIITDFPPVQNIQVVEPIKESIKCNSITKSIEVSTESENTTPAIIETQSEKPCVIETPQKPLSDTPEKPVVSETPEKKKKKKKKPVSLIHKSGSNATLNCDDSYDFLIENSILEEFEQKTNVEISQELDRIIQKGMYNNLEEKIKAMNINLDDAFFKTVSKPEYQPSTSSRGVSTWNLQESQDKGEDKQNTAINLTNIQNFSISPERILRKSPSPSSYPITQAVKEWMTKTRENTPDIELLKSPNTIYKEFCNDDDVTLWSANNIEEESETNLKVDGKIEDCEEAIEVYESRYGNNEDFLRIKSEIEAQKNNRGFAGHGDLPYRAICCNLM